MFYNYYNYATDETGFAYHHVNYVSKYYGITQNPITKNFMIIIKYYELGDLTRYVTNNFYNINEILLFIRYIFHQKRR